MRTVLIAVDVQNDFLPGGPMGLPGNEVILKHLLNHETDASLLVIARRLFDPGTEFARFPPHCIKGSKGVKIHRDLEELADYIVTKKGPSAFEGGTLRPLQSLEDILKEEKVDRVLIGGYYLELDVAQTAFDANALGYETTVLKDATASGASLPFISSHGTWGERFERAGVRYA